MNIFENAEATPPKPVMESQSSTLFKEAYNFGVTEFDSLKESFKERPVATTLETAAVVVISAALCRRGVAAACERIGGLLGRDTAPDFAPPFTETFKNLRRPFEAEMMYPRVRPVAAETFPAWIEDLRAKGWKVTDGGDFVLKPQAK